MCLILTSIRERIDSTCYRTERFVGSSMGVTVQSPNLIHGTSPPHGLRLYFSLSATLVS